MRITMNGTYEFIPNTDSPFAAAWAGTHNMTDITIDYDVEDLVALAAAMGVGADAIMIDATEGAFADDVVDHKPMDDLLIGQPVDEDDESHQCTHPVCTTTVAFDDEPYCFTHSPDDGSTVPGYSYKRAVRGLPDNVVL